MVTEDIDITWKLEKHFWHIRYEPGAVCWILVPETLKGLWRQRFRWSQEGVEVLRKHANIWKDYRQRRLWPVYMEYVVSVLWAYSFWGFVSLWGLKALFGHLFPFAVMAPVPPAWTGSILWLLGIRHFYLEIIQKSGYLDFLHLVERVGWIILIVFGILRLWGWYNYKKFGHLNRRKFPRSTTPEQLSKYFEVPVETIKTLQTQKEVLIDTENAHP